MIGSLGADRYTRSPEPRGTGSDARRGRAGVAARRREESVTRSIGAGAGGRLGTFGGVFTPSVLTILGLILFLRLGFVVGDVGLPRALLILAIATIISASTSVSLSAIRIDACR